MAHLLIKSDLEFHFRESRDYIYGPDLFFFSLKESMKFFKTEKLQNVDFSSHNMAKSGLDFYLYNEPAENKHPNIQSKLVFKNRSKEYYAYLIPNEKKITQRKPYPEEIVFETSKISLKEKMIVLPKSTPFLLTDNFTALTKYLHKNVFPEISGKWIFVRIIYNEYQIENPYSELKVIVAKNFSNKYTKNLLYKDNKIIGTLYFSLIK